MVSRQRSELNPTVVEQRAGTYQQRINRLRPRCFLQQPPRLAGLHLAAGLAGGCDREPRAFRPGRGERCYNRPLDAFRPRERDLARKP